MADSSTLLNYTHQEYTKEYNLINLSTLIPALKGEAFCCNITRLPEVTSHGYPKNKANTLRLQALARLLDYAYHHGVGVVVFENLDRVKRRAFTKSPKANRKMSRFPKRKLVQHGVITALRHGFRVCLVNPAYTSTIGEVIGRELGLDRHTASAYTLVLRYLGVEPKALKIAQVAKSTKM